MKTNTKERKGKMRKKNFVLMIIILVAVGVQPVFADGWEVTANAGVSGNHWGSIDFNSFDKGFSVDVNTGAEVLSSSTMSSVTNFPRGAASSWEGGASVNTSFDFGNMRGQLNSWHNVQVGTMVDP